MLARPMPRALTLPLAFCLTMMVPVIAHAGDGQLAWGEMIMGLLGGLAIFLYGMDVMADALKSVAGERMKTILARLTVNRFAGVATGAVVTAIIQSSSVTTVLLVGFVSVGLMTLAQSIGVTLGAAVGTTITAQIVAFKVTKYALGMVAIGFGFQFFSNRDRIKQIGLTIMGLGLIFLGMGLMGDGMRPLRTYEPFISFMSSMENPLFGILTAMAFTGLIQSSSAAIGIIITLASQGLVPLDAGIALMLGANVGTTITAVLAGIGKPREAKRVALAHVIFKIIGVLLWVGFTKELAEMAMWLSPAHEGAGHALQAAETPRQIANAHTVFNVVNCLVFIGFTGPLARLATWMLPDKPEEEGRVLKPKYLDQVLVENPVLGLEAARRELERMGRRVVDMLKDALPAVTVGDAECLDALVEQDEEVDLLHGHIIGYLAEISRGDLSSAESKCLVRMMEAVNDLEQIGDTIEKNLVAAGMSRLKHGVTISAETLELIKSFHVEVMDAVEQAVAAVTADDRATAKLVVKRKDEIMAASDLAMVHLADRLLSDEPDRVATYRVETDVLEQLRRIYYKAKRIAKAVPKHVL